MPHPARVLRRPATALATIATLTALAACGSDAPPTAPAARRSVVRTTAAPASASYTLGTEPNGTVWTLDAPTSTLRSSRGEYIALSPSVAGYFINVAESTKRVAGYDAVIAQALARARAAQCGTQRICPTDTPIPGDSMAPDPVGPAPIDPFPVDPADTVGVVLPITDSLGALLADGSGTALPPVESFGLDGTFAAATPAFTLGVDMGGNGTGGAPGQMCRDIVDAWARQQSGYQAAQDAYGKAAAGLFGGLMSLIGTTRYDTLQGRLVNPGPDPLHPSTESVRDFIASFKDINDLWKWVGLRYGAQAATVNFDVRGLDVVSAQIRRSIYAGLFNSYDCANVLRSTQAPPPKPPSSGTGGGGGSGATSRITWCYYAVWTSNGSEVSRTFLGCW